MNDRRLGLILKRLGHVLHELGDFIVLAAEGDEEHHERPTADIPAALPHCPGCGTQQICPKCDLRFTGPGQPMREAQTATCIRCSTRLVFRGREWACPQCDAVVVARWKLEAEAGEAPTERATDAPDKATAERQVADIGRVLGLEFPDEDEPDIGQAPSNLGNGPVPLFIDGDEDPEDEVQVEQSEFTVGEPERG